MNPMFSMMSQVEKPIYSPGAQRILDNSIQFMLRDACRVFHLKIFKVDIYERCLTEDQIIAATKGPQDVEDEADKSKDNSTNVTQ